MAKTPEKKTAAEPSSKSRTFDGKLKPQQTPDAANAEMMVDGLGMNAVTAMAYSKSLGDLDLTECVAALVEEARRVKGGNLAGLEATLAAQAVTLNAMFTQLAHQTSRMTVIDQIDRFTRLALKAQGQYRATVETLAVIKNPPVFARQANISSGPQQVNNGPVLNGGPSRAAIQECEPNRLLEEMTDGARLDGRTQEEAGRSDPALAAVGALDGPANRRG